MRNPETPLLEDREIGVTNLWSAPGAESLWESPRFVRAVEGRVYVLDPPAASIYLLDSSDGSDVGMVGGKGRGPHELSDPYGLAVIDRALVVGDGGSASLKVFTRDGSYSTAIPFGALGFNLLPFGPDRVLAYSFLGDTAAWSVVTLDGGRRIFSMPEPVAGEHAHFADCARISTSGSRVLRVGCTVPHIQIVDGSGAAVREIVIPREPERPSAGEMEAYLENIRSTMQRSGLPTDIIATQLRLAEDRYSAVDAIRGARADLASGALAVWEQRPDELGGGPARLHLLTPDGVYLRQIDFTRPWVDFDLSGSTVYALERDPSTDLVTLTAYQLAPCSLLRSPCD